MFCTYRHLGQCVVEYYGRPSLADYFDEGAGFIYAATHLGQQGSKHMLYNFRYSEGLDGKVPE
ncbi:hypothetical protein ACLOJK_033211 [Asimina triloba]